VYQNENASARANLVYDYQVIEDRAKLLETMVTTPEVLREKVLLGDPPATVPPNGPSTGAEIPAQVEFSAYGMDRAVVDVSTARPGFLVMSDLYTPDWKARVDGSEADLLNADYAYRAVYVPEGEHQVEFYYQPGSFTLGKVLSLVGLVVLFALLIIQRFVRRK
jgi:hypothetical protein